MIARRLDLRGLVRLATASELALSLALSACSGEVMPPEDTVDRPEGQLPVASVVVSPSSAFMAQGDTARLTATTWDSAGNQLVGHSITWASEDAAIAAVDSDGLVTGIGAGTVAVTASAEGKSGSSTVTVAAGPPPPPTTIDTIFIEDFESGNLSAWDDNFLAARKTVENDPSLAFSGSHYLRIFYPQGGDGGSLSKFLLPGYETMYVGYHVQLPSTWQGGTKLVLFRGSRTDDIWSSFGKAGDCPDGTDFFTANVVTRDQANLPLRFYTYYVGMAEEPGGGVCWGRYGDANDPGGAPSPPATYFVPLDVSKGVWHHLEFEVILNTPGQANGEQRFWFDGELRGEWIGLQFRTTTDLMLNVLTLESSMNERQGAPQDQALYVDAILVTTRRPTP